MVGFPLVFLVKLRQFRMTELSLIIDSHFHGTRGGDLFGGQFVIVDDGGNEMVSMRRSRYNGRAIPKIH